ncbi:MAG: FMN-binding negative transcriptional regulator [Flavobacteriaceae bacterium]|nr:FMN-binding negative transcriptional regulator [Flavobacteriaceae bacterium]
MKYPPKHYQDHNKLHMIEVIKEYPLATVISVKDNQPLITHLPLVFEDDKLIGHIDKFNPHAELLKSKLPVSVIFHGPEAYISPSLFKTKTLPTYNYIRVHLKGTVIEVVDKEALKTSLIKMTDFLEHPQHNYVLDANNKSMERNLNYIKMFEISIDSWEGKFKLSKDKSPEDFAIAKEELIKINQISIKPLLKKIL